MYQKLVDSSDASSPAPEPVEPPAPVYQVRKETAGSWAEQRRTTETARRAVGFVTVEQAVDSVACAGTPAADAYEGKFTKLTMLVAEMVKKDTVFKASCENFESGFDVKTGGAQATRLVDGLIHMLLNHCGFTDEQAQATSMLVATRKARSGSTGRKNADITALLKKKSRHHVIVSSGRWSYQAGRVEGGGSGTWRLGALHSAHPPMDQRSWNSSDGCTSGIDRKLKGEHLLAATRKATETQEHAGSEGRANRMRSVAHGLLS